MSQKDKDHKPGNDEDQPDLGSVAKQSSPDQIEIKFTVNNTNTIREMVGIYGKNEKYVVYTAVALLISIFNKTQSCDSITIHDKSDKSYRIDLPHIE